MSAICGGGCRFQIWCWSPMGRIQPSDSTLVGFHVLVSNEGGHFLNSTCKCWFLNISPPHLPDPLYDLQGGETKAHTSGHSLGPF